VACLLVDLSEFLFRLWRLIYIRVVLLGQLEISFLDIVLIGALGDLEDPVQVFFLVRAPTEERHFWGLVK
jgi:hypothetical protein